MRKNPERPFMASCHHTQPPWQADSSRSPFMDSLMQPTAAIFFVILLWSSIYIHIYIFVWQVKTGRGRSGRFRLRQRKGEDRKGRRGVEEEEEAAAAADAKNSLLARWMLWSVARIPAARNPSELASPSACPRCSRFYDLGTVSPWLSSGASRLLFSNLPFTRVCDLMMYWGLIWNCLSSLSLLQYIGCSRFGKMVII